MFDYYQIETKIQRALSRKVWLKCGGYLIIDRTEALTVIDVNTGKFVGDQNLEDTVLKTNMEATKEIAKQLRLRDIGGIVVIDFIDMSNAQHQQMIIDALKLALKNDRTKTIVLGMTGLGLVEMTRKKIRQELSTVMSCDCPICDGSGKIPSAEASMREVLKQIDQYLLMTDAVEVNFEVHNSILAKLENRMIKLLKNYNNNIKISISGTNDIKFDGLRIKRIDTDTLVC